MHSTPQRGCRLRTLQPPLVMSFKVPASGVTPQLLLVADIDDTIVVCAVPQIPSYNQTDSALHAPGNPVEASQLTTNRIALISTHAHTTNTCVHIHTHAHLHHARSSHSLMRAHVTMCARQTHTKASFLCGKSINMSGQCRE